jgi:hypothetical protein
LPNNRLTGRIFSPHTYPNGVNTYRVSGRGYPLPSLTHAGIKCGAPLRSLNFWSCLLLASFSSCPRIPSTCPSLLLKPVAEAGPATQAGSEPGGGSPSHGEVMYDVIYGVHIASSCGWGGGGGGSTPSGYIRGVKNRLAKNPGGALAFGGDILGHGVRHSRVEGDDSDKEDPRAVRQHALAAIGLHRRLASGTCPSAQSPASRRRCGLAARLLGRGQQIPAQAQAGASFLFFSFSCFLMFSIFQIHL